MIVAMAALASVVALDASAGEPVGFREQCRKQLWVTYHSFKKELEWKVWPRGLAFAEVAWSNPDPAKRDFAEFSARAAEHRRHLIRDHVNCAPLK